jgi:hypothetical protein
VFFSGGLPVSSFNKCIAPGAVKEGEENTSKIDPPSLEIPRRTQNWRAIEKSTKGLSTLTEGNFRVLLRSQPLNKSGKSFSVEE